MEDLWLSENSMNESPFDGSEQEETQGVLKQQDSTSELHSYE